MTMNDLDDCISTIEEISKDTTNGQFMSNSKESVFNFDAVKEKYLRKLSLPIDKCNSVDGLLKRSNVNYFIEFKNGRICSSNIYLKIQDSIIIYCDICNKHISDIRQSYEFILVYNEDKHPKEKIHMHINKNAGEKYIAFSMGKYQKVYFKDVHTYTKKEFEDFLSSSIFSN